MARSLIHQRNRQSRQHRPRTTPRQKKKPPASPSVASSPSPASRPTTKSSGSSALRSDHRRPGQRHLRAEKCRGPQRLVHDRHQHRGQQISARQDRHARARNRRPRSSSRRVAETIRDWGMAQGYFRTHRRRRHFPRRTCPHPRPPVRRLQFARLVQRRMRPHRAQLRRHATGTGTRRPQQVEFGVTGYTKPQCSACFINSVKDSLDSILTLAKTEGMLFKWGMRHRHQSLAAARHRPKRSPAAALPAARSAS